MTDSITLFKNGLVASPEHSAQPRLPDAYRHQLDNGWSLNDTEARTRRAIAHLARLLPVARATPAGKPLFGAQQIPGSDPKLRAADVSFEGHPLRPGGNCKGQLALTAADRIVAKLTELGWLTSQGPLSPDLALSQRQSAAEVESIAIRLAEARGCPRGSWPKTAGNPGDWQPTVAPAFSPSLPRRRGRAERRLE
ncbi:hypothetical protein MBH78_23455 [Oceanimonas sp. NS1]|nr:hypothetical protein [Oceanimonas sp. NS1]